jgi:hypothetical protein
MNSSADRSEIRLKPCAQCTVRGHYCEATETEEGTDRPLCSACKFDEPCIYQEIEDKRRQSMPRARASAVPSVPELRRVLKPAESGGGRASGEAETGLQPAKHIAERARPPLHSQPQHQEKPVYKINPELLTDCAAHDTHGCKKQVKKSCKSGYCASHFYLSKRKTSAKKSVSHRPARKAELLVRDYRKSVAKESRDGVATICVTESSLDRFWKALSLDEKAGIFTAQLEKGIAG